MMYNLYMDLAVSFALMTKIMPHVDTNLLEMSKLLKLALSFDWSILCARFKSERGGTENRRR